MSDILAEVERDLRQERLARLAARYGGLLAGVLLLIVLGVAGLQGWRWWQARQTADAAAVYLAAAAAEAPPAAAADRFATVAAAAPPGYRALARLREAGARAEAGDREGALASLDALSRDGTADPLWRELATVQWGLHALDGPLAAGVAARVAPIADGQGPWRAAAAEVRALAALATGDRDAARRGFAALAVDNDVPQGVRERAARLLTAVRG